MVQLIAVKNEHCFKDPFITALRLMECLICIFYINGGVELKAFPYNLVSRENLPEVERDLKHIITN